MPVAIRPLMLVFSDACSSPPLVGLWYIILAGRSDIAEKAPNGFLLPDHLAVVVTIHMCQCCCIDTSKLAQSRKALRIQHHDEAGYNWTVSTRGPNCSVYPGICIVFPVHCMHWSVLAYIYYGYINSLCFVREICSELFHLKTRGGVERKSLQSGGGGGGGGQEQF